MQSRDLLPESCYSAAGGRPTAVKKPKRDCRMKPMPATVEELASLLVERVRQYERNCRCLKCHCQESGPLQCIDCDLCLANLRKLMLGELESQPVRFSGCSAEEDRATLPSMKTAKATRKTTTRAKATKLKSPKMKAKATPRMKKKPVRAVRLPVLKR